MYSVLLVDDEPLILIGLQSMIDWSSNGYKIVGTARNGKDALEQIDSQHPDIVISDIKMANMDGLELASACRDKYEGLPVFIMLTSYENFDSVRKSMSAGAVDYLTKIDLSPETLIESLERAKQHVDKERALLNIPAIQNAENQIKAYRDIFFLQLFGDNFPSEDIIISQARELELDLSADHYYVAIARLLHKSMDTPQLATLSDAVTRTAAVTLPKYTSAHVTGMDLRHFAVLFLSKDGSEISEDRIKEILETLSETIYNYFSASLLWAIGVPADNLMDISKSEQTAFAALPLLSQNEPIVFCRKIAKTQLDHKARVVSEVQDYIRKNLSQKLSLNEVASTFGFSASYLSQLFSQSGETGFAGFVTATRVTAAKELMATTDLKIYEISEKSGFESPFYFSKVFKKLEGMSPRDYMRHLRGEADDSALEEEEYEK